VVNIPSQPEIITVNSEELQTLIRNLLPSQRGFGSELQASNVITPIIDLTAAAEGSSLREDLQTALAFGSQTTFQIQNTTTTIVNSPGFYRVIGCVTNLGTVSSGSMGGTLHLTDGSTTKTLWGMVIPGVSTGVNPFSESFDFTVFLRPGDTLQGFSDNAGSIMTGSHRQVATGDGTIVQPNGFPL